MVSDVTTLSWERLLSTDRGMVCGEYIVWVKDGNWHEGIFLIFW